MAHARPPWILLGKAAERRLVRYPCPQLLGPHSVALAVYKKWIADMCIFVL